MFLEDSRCLIEKRENKTQTIQNELESRFDNAIEHLKSNFIHSNKYKWHWRKEYYREILYAVKTVLAHLIQDGDIKGVEIKSKHIKRDEFKVEFEVTVDFFFPIKKKGFTRRFDITPMHPLKPISGEYETIKI